MSYDAHPLHPSLIRPADPEYRVDLAPETQETLRRRAEPVHPTMHTTAGRREWRWGRSVDRPSNSGAPLVVSPSDLERAPVEQPAPASIRDVVARMKP